MRAVNGLVRAARKTKKTVHRVKLLKPLYKNRKRLVRVLKSMGQVVEKRL